MTTTVTKSIGTAGGRDYSLMSAWIADCPSDLTAVDQIWKGEAYNDSEFTASVSFAGITADATRFPWLTAAAGQSFCDHASKDSNPQCYDQSKGVGLKAPAPYGTFINSSMVWIRIERIQFCFAGTFIGGNNMMSMGNVCQFRHCLYQSERTGNSEFAFYGNSELYDCVLILNSASGHSGQLFYSGNVQNKIIGCTMVCTSDAAAANCVYTGYSYFPQVIGCAIFGFTTPFANASMANLASAGCDYNYSDVSATNLPGTHSVGSLTYASQFEGVTRASIDFRAKSTGSLGGTVPTPTPTIDYFGLDGKDVVLHTRGNPQTAGGWEITGPSTPPPQLLYPVSDIATNSWLPFPGAFETVRNLLTYTEDFSHAPWGTTNASIVADAATDPLGTSTADKLREASDSFKQHYVYRTTPGLAASSTYTFSIHGLQSARIGISLLAVNRDGTSCTCDFYLEGSGISPSGPTNCTPAIATAANGHYRCSIAYSSGSGGGTPEVQVKLLGGSGSPLYNGDGSSGAFLWGAQLDLGALTAYQPIIALDPPSTTMPTLASKMDEAAADPADYAYSPDNPTTEEFEVALTVAGSPGSGQDLIADYQLRAIGLTTSFRLTLMCGATQIDQWTDSVTVADGDKTNTHTVLAASANSITNYADLRLRGRASA